MDALAPWPALVRRLRFLTSVTQSQLAQIMGVDRRPFPGGSDPLRSPTCGLDDEYATCCTSWNRRSIPPLLRLCLCSP
jgi:hypothetical protein